jgi:hypothetical protein
MGSVSVQTIASAKTLGPGQESHRTWNNASDNPVLVEVYPSSAGDPSKTVEFTAEFEITRQWRRRIAKDTGTGVIGHNVAYENEIHYVVKNLGSQTGTYSVRMVTYKS